MKRLLAVALAAVAAAALVTTDFADARRLGAGRNFGAQRQQIAPQPATPPAASPAAPGGAASNPVMPAQPGAAAASRAAPGAAAAPASGMSRWLGPIAGLAAGLGLAALAAHLGLSETLMSVMLVVLAVVVGIAILRMIFARRSAPPRAPMAYAPTPASGATPRSSFEPVFGGSRTPATPVSGRYPPGFDAAAFLDQAKQQFRRLQSAYDVADRAALADVMTPEMFSEVARDLDMRGPHTATEIVSLNPEIVDVSTEGDRHWASVRFTGLLREDGANSPKPFDELWNLSKPVDGSSGWLLAGIRQLDEEPASHA